MAEDKNKDQSYFLWTLTQKQLKRCLFPMGNYKKSEIRRLAKKLGLLTAEKKDSQGICFLGKVTIKDFLKKYIPTKKGAILSATGKVMGEHDGSYFYTIGQRRGLSISGSKNPLYIAGKNSKSNTITVVEGKENPALYKKEIIIDNVNFIGLPDNKLVQVFARVRYRQPLAKANLYKLTAKKYKLIFIRPQKFIAPGQSAVFYGKNRELLGGGVIC